MINEELKINNFLLNNRIVFQPMEGCDGTETGGISELTRRRYMRFAESGAAVIWFEAVAVTAEGRANPRQLYLNENTKQGFKDLISDIKARALQLSGYAPVIIMQATHSGRWSKPHGLPEPLVAYRNELWEKGKEDLPYVVVSDEYCDTLPEKFAAATIIADEVGFDGIDVKCCHGYLFNEFLSAFERPGRYGGSIHNRTRLYFNCLEAVKEKVSDKMFVTTRLNACDCFPYPYGYGVDKAYNIDLSETKYIILELIKRGVKIIDLTLGNPYLIPHVNRPSRGAPESIEVGMSRIYKVTAELQNEFKDVAFVASGLSAAGANCVDYADKLISDGVCKLAGFGRMTFAYPNFYKDYLKDGINKNKCCIACGKCTELMRHGSVTGCPVRDFEVYMPFYKKYVLGENK